jgi:hypothetical protein
MYGATLVDRPDPCRRLQRADPPVTPEMIDPSRSGKPSHFQADENQSNTVGIALAFSGQTD